MTAEYPSEFITSIGFTRASDSDVRRGLIGFLTCIVADTIMLDGICLRMTESGRPTLSYPERTDGKGRRHPLIRPLNDCARKAIEKAIFDALGVDPGGTQ